MKVNLSNRIAFYLERALPAAILVFVALLQIYLVNTTNLSPWKGGGFGMFAAVDAPSMRVIVAEGLDEAGELLRIDAYSLLPKSTERQIRSFPRRSDLQQLGEALLSNSLVPTTIKYDYSLQQLLADNPDLQKLDRPPFQKILFSSSSTTSGPLYRVRTGDDPEVSSLAKSLKAARIQWWRIHFNNNDKRLTAEPLTASVEVGDWNQVFDE